MDGYSGQRGQPRGAWGVCRPLRSVGRKVDLGQAAGGQTEAGPQTMTCQAQEFIPSSKTPPFFPQC